MSVQPSSIQFLSDREIAMERVFNAPRALVWQAYTQAEHLRNWWGLRANTTRIDAHDLRPGGAWRYVETSPDGTEHAFRGEFREVTPIERLVHTFEYEPMAGHIIVESATFEDLGAQTRLRTRSLFASQEDRDGMIASGMEGGALESWARLEEELAHMQGESVASTPAAGGAEPVPAHPEDVLEISRTVNAPRDLVFAVCTQPEHLLRWWGPKGMNMKVATVDLRPGGLFHYAIATPSGDEMWGRFVYGTVTPPERLEYVNAFSDAAAAITRHPLAPTWPAEVQNIWLFSEAGDSTIIHMRGWPINANDEERALWRQSRDSVKGGMKGTFGQLDEYLATLSLAA